MKPDAINSLKTIVDDMKTCGADLPHGIPSYYDWVKCPLVFSGSHAYPNVAVNPWGQVYRTTSMDSLNSSTNTRVQLRNLDIYYLSKSTKTWVLWMHTPKIVGGYFREDFSNDSQATDSLNLKYEQDGGISVKLIQNFNFHFFSEYRVFIDPLDVEAVWSYCEARLIVDNKNLPDDRDETEFILNIGGDYWIDLQADWEPSWVTNSDIGMGRFKYITKKWQAFNMQTTTEDVILSNPPPFK